MALIIKICQTIKIFFSFITHLYINVQTASLFSEEETMTWLDEACEADSYASLYEMAKKWERLDSLIRATLLKAASQSDTRLYEKIMEIQEMYRQERRRYLRGRQMLNIIFDKKLLKKSRCRPHSHFFCLIVVILA